MLKTKKSWLLMLFVWLLAAGVLSSFAPGAKEQTSPQKNNGLPETAASIQAEKALEKYFPSSEGIPLFIVVHDKTGLKDNDVEKAIIQIEKLEKASPFSMVSLSKMPEKKRASFFAKDNKTFFIPVLFPEGLENKEVKINLDKLKNQVKKDMPSNLETYFTGPAGIAADTYEMFSKADIVLLAATVGLIFVLLIVIYRSPLLAVIPLIGAGIVYIVADRLLGLMGKYGWFTIDSQSLSIMTILLFAIITDYSLLLFSRFREELGQGFDTSQAMRNALNFVKEPIVFSGGTVFLSMLTLFFAVYETYRGFAPVFAAAVVLMLIAGLTLIPSLFAVAGEKAFWPSNPRNPSRKQERSKENLWHKLGRFVTEKPWISLLPVVVVLMIFASMVTNTNYTFNLLDSFPKDMSSVQGYNQLTKSFSAGEIAPSTVIVKAKKDLSEEQIQRLEDKLGQVEGVAKAEIQGNPYAEGFLNVAKIKLIFKNNPYSEKAFDDLEKLRTDSTRLLKSAGINDAELWIASETAINADLRNVSRGDEIRVMILVTLSIMVMLAIQTRSLAAPVYIMLTILLSYGAALGFTVFFFQNLLGFTGISYRIPLYTFVFLVALGVDYSIMLISRIREEEQHLPLKDAVREGIGKTGGVISSAGLILAATFAVLMTQPVMELRVFGFAVAAGVLVDTFIVRPIAIPAFMVILGPYSFWPKKVKGVDARSCDFYSK